MRIIKVTDVKSFAAKITPKQPQKNKTIVESILKNVKKNGDKHKVVAEFDAELEKLILVPRMVGG